jgi:CubicO group peptidase (beta-lactamase class C family)
MYQMLEDENSKAFIVLKDGKIVLEKYFGTFTKDSIWYWASAGKTLTAALVGIAQKDGYLNIDSSTSKYIGNGWSSAPLNKEKLITVKHQLTMTSGFDDGVPDNHCTIDTCLQYLADAGTRWAYHNAPYTILDSVIENATAQNFNQYFNTKLRNKIGMNGLWLNVDYDHVYFSNARSFARYGLLLLNKGNWSGTSVIADSNYYASMVNTSQTLNNSYGYLTWLNGKSSYMVPESQITIGGSILEDAPNDMFMALGKNGQFINVVPSHNLVLIRMGNVPSDNNPLPFLLNNTIWKWMNKLMCNESSIQGIELNKINISPNPTNNTINISSQEKIQYPIRLFDMHGDFIRNEYSHLIEVSKLPSGIYFLSVNANGAVHNVKFVKLN